MNTHHVLHFETTAQHRESILDDLPDPGSMMPALETLDLIEDVHMLAADLCKAEQRRASSEASIEQMLALASEGGAPLRLGVAQRLVAFDTSLRVERERDMRRALVGSASLTGARRGLKRQYADVNKVGRASRALSRALSALEAANVRADARRRALGALVGEQVDTLWEM